MNQSICTYSEPIIPGFYPDPNICRVESDYYLITSSFQYFPGVPIFRSRDLVNWTQIGHCLTRRSQLELEGCLSSMGIFAPTLRYHNGRFYMITTNTRSFRNFYVWAEQPEGPWSDPVWLDWPGIDPSLFFDEDGHVYITGPGGFLGDEQAGIYQAEIDMKNGELLTERRLIWTGTGGKAPEGPHLYRIGSQYYLIIAEGGTEYGHMVTAARSERPYGPFESCPHNPILSHRSLGHPVQATGHADLVQAQDGSWWAVFLGIRPAPVPFAGLHHHLGRETFLSPVFWTEDGWPIIGDASEAVGRTGTGNLPADKTPFEETTYHFNQSALPLEWNSLRNLPEECWKLDQERGGLILYGNEATLDDAGSPAFFGRRQQHFHCEASALLEFCPEREAEEAGLTVYMNERFHYEIALTQKAGRRRIIFRRRIGTLWKVEHEADYEANSIILTVKADPKWYEFSYSMPEGPAVPFGRGECSLLSSETAGGFTGVYLGLYASGGGSASSAAAAFRWFRYAPGHLGDSESGTD
ncbi:glycoside hydrolase family 43 protein [Saccharibacillus kuerlensis]|uniref:Glycoside hydrolase 43 family protein n=1 Tax=Saccharibacillus kuerlensis TaxID=459527 RepID=A0ABQ2L9M0_9BACL|nr:glycoside hydrolase family 43 protein [Saccharibacillus kuerlensis]GGO06672.1 glycoside hydrolase 43 family protein [Saccharibacillus kuerlensis]